MSQGLYGVAQVGRWNGEIARPQAFSHAAASLVMVGAAAIFGIPTVLLAVAGILMITLPFASALISVTANRPGALNPA